MPIQLEVKTLEGVSEELQPFYKEKDGGDAFMLDIEGLPDTKGLKTALEKERKTVKSQKEQLSTFKEVDLEQYADLQSREAALSEHDPEKVEEMINKRIKKNDTKWQNDMAALDKKLSETRGKLSTVMVSDELRRVGTQLGVNGDEAMSDFVARGRGIFQVSDEGSVVAMQGEDVLYGESGVDPLTMTEFGKKLSETATHLFKSSSGGGADNSGGGKARSGTIISKADLKTDADKAGYIGKHGRNAFLALPAKREAG